MPKDSVVPQSYKGLTLEEARLFLRNTMDLFQSLSSMADLKTMYEAGKQLSRLYFDCANHQRELAEILLELEFPEYTIKTMKKLNNMGVFKNDDIWFSSFYFYNICWNYSDASFEFATALALCGLPNLLNLNIGHKPYLDNLSSRNVYYLIKASLSIIHNVCRFPGSCIYFRSEAVKSSLLNLINREEDFIRVVASLCLASIVAENEAHLLRGDDTEERPDVLLAIIGYIRKARHSERGRFMGFRSYELLQGVRSATTVECERRHFLELDGVALLRDSLLGKAPSSAPPSSLPSSAVPSAAGALDEDVAECLEIACNLSVGGRELQLKLAEGGIDAVTIAAFATHDNARIRAAAHDFLWSVEAQLPASVSESAFDGGYGGADAIDLGKPLPVFISYASINRFSVLKIRDRLADANIVRFVEADVRGGGGAEAVRAAIRKSALVIVCVSEAFKSQPQFQLAVELCERARRPIVPLLIQQKYRPEGWLQRAIERDLTVFDLSSKRDFEASWETFIASIAARLKEIRAELQRQAEARVKQEKVVMGDHPQHTQHHHHHGQQPLPSSILPSPPPSSAMMQQHNKQQLHEEDYRNSIDDVMSRSHHLAEPLPTLCDGGGGGAGSVGGGYRRYNGADSNSVDVGTGAVSMGDGTRQMMPQAVAPRQHHGDALPAAMSVTGDSCANELSAAAGTMGTAAVTMGTTTMGMSAGSVHAWLDTHELGHLRPQLGWLNCSLLRYYQRVKSHAPEYFYQTLEKQLKLEFVDILKFSNAIDHL